MLSAQKSNTEPFRLSDSLPYPNRAIAKVYPSGDFTGSKLGSPLGLSLSTNSRNRPSIDAEALTRQRRGSNGMTPGKRRQLRSATAIMQERYPRQLGFITTTEPTLLPGATDAQRTAAHLAYVQNFPIITKRFLESCRRHLEAVGLPTDYVYCIELQEQRWKNHGVVSPHIHLLLVTKKSRWDKRYSVAVSQVANWWKRAVIAGTGIENWFFDASTRIEAPRKTLENEIGKYMTKGGKILADIKKAGLISHLPKTWGEISRLLKIEVRERTIRLEGVKAAWLFDNREFLRSVKLIDYFDIYRTDADGSKTLAGYSGRFTSKKAMSDVLLMMDLNCPH